MIISVEGHQMTVVASDGQEVEPEVVKYKNKFLATLVALHFTPVSE